MNEWKTVRLGDVCELIMGTSPEGNTISDNPSNGIEFHQGKTFFGKVFLNESKIYTSAPSRFANAGNVIMSVRAPVGDSNITQRRIAIGRGLCTFNLKDDFEKFYLFYFLNSKIEYLQSKSTGSTFKAVNKDAISDLQIPLPPLEEQKHIAAVLDKCTALIAKHKQMLEKYDTLIKSRFIEMFGNPQCISNNWEVKPLSDYCIVNPKKSELGPIPDDYELSFIPMQSVSENGDVDTSSIKHYKDVKTGFTYFRENDVLFAKITPCMENGKGGVARNLKNQIGFGSTEFHVLRPIETISNSEWIYRLTTFKTFRKDAENNMTGSAGQRRTPKEFFDKYKVGLPPIELQNEFSTFVQQIDKSKFEYTYTGVAA